MDLAEVAPRKGALFADAQAPGQPSANPEQISVHNQPKVGGLLGPLQRRADSFHLFSPRAGKEYRSRSLVRVDRCRMVQVSKSSTATPQRERAPGQVIWTLSFPATACRPSFLPLNSVADYPIDELRPSRRLFSRQTSVATYPETPDVLAWSCLSITPLK